MNVDTWGDRIEAAVAKSGATDTVSALDAIIIAGEISPITLSRVPTLSGDCIQITWADGSSIVMPEGDEA